MSCLELFFRAPCSSACRKCTFLCTSGIVQAFGPQVSDVPEQEGELNVSASEMLVPGQPHYMYGYACNLMDP